MLNQKTKPEEIEKVSSGFFCEPKRHQTHHLRFYKTVVYNYDAFGNITSKTVSSCTLSETDPTGTTVDYGYMSVGVPGQIKSYNGKNLSNYSDQPYSSYGQPLVYFNHRSPTSYWEMIWDVRNLKIMQLRNVNGTALQETLNFRYDGNGIRKTKIYNGATTDYINAGNRLVREIRGNVELTYLYGLDGAIGFEYKNAENQISRYYYQKNIQGDIKNIIDKDGKIVVQYAYDAWGNHKIYRYLNDSVNAIDITEDSSYNNDIAKVNPFRYKGYYYDTETGLFYCTSRYYDPEIGRFISADNVEVATTLGAGFINGLNLYAYAANNPVNVTDSTGYFWDYVFDAISIIWSVVDLVKNLSWENAGWLALDVGLAIIPFVPAIGGKIAKGVSKIDEFADVAKYANRIDNAADIVVIGNDMGRVTSMAMDVGGSIYKGFGPLSKAINMGEDVSSALMKAAKLDNAVWLMNKFYRGYKIIDVGRDARTVAAMWKSAYGMERKLLMMLRTLRYSAMASQAISRGVRYI